MRPDRADVVRELGNRLNEQGRFAVLDGAQVEVFLKIGSKRDSALIKEMGSRLGVEVIGQLRSIRLKAVSSWSRLGCFMPMMRSRLPRSWPCLT